MKLVTGASQNHEKSLLQLIRSVLQHIQNPFQTLIVYDLGLSSNALQMLHKHKITVRPFPFSQYPDYFNIDVEAGQYAWKPVIVQIVAQEYSDENVIWMDAGNVVHNELKQLDDFVLENGIFTGVSSGTVKKWTHPGTLKYMDVPDKMLSFPCRNAACVGFNPRIPYAKDVLEEWAQLAQQRDCIAPLTSSRVNHRQDQAILTILFYKCILKHSFQMYNAAHGLGYTIHNDVD